MHFAEILGSRSKEQNNYNFNEIGLIFRLALNHFSPQIILIQIKI